MRVSAKYSDDDKAYYPIDVICPPEITVTEAKQLILELQTAIEVIEWENRTKVAEAYLLTRADGSTSRFVKERDGG